MKKSSVRLAPSVAWEKNVPLTATLVKVPMYPYNPIRPSSLRTEISPKATLPEKEK